MTCPKCGSSNISEGTYYDRICNDCDWEFDIEKTGNSDQTMDYGYWKFIQDGEKIFEFPIGHEALDSVVRSLLEMRKAKIDEINLSTNEIILKAAN